jgi:hypothetical protein
MHGGSMVPQNFGGRVTDYMALRITFQKILLFIVTVVKTSEPTFQHVMKTIIIIMEILLNTWGLCSIRVHTEGMTYPGG